MRLAASPSMPSPRQSAQFAPEVRRQIFFSDPVGISAGSANPRGRAVAVPGGYRVTGHWFFASGCMHSSALHGACKVFDGDRPRLRPNGDQEIRIAYFYPKSIARIVDTWDVSGLRGTGSHDIEVEDLGKLSVLAGVREFPVRVKCASLAWHTFKAALENQDKASSE